MNQKMPIVSQCLQLTAVLREQIKDAGSFRAMGWKFLIIYGSGSLSASVAYEDVLHKHDKVCNWLCK